MAAPIAASAVLQQRSGSQSTAALRWDVQCTANPAYGGAGRRLVGLQLSRPLPRLPDLLTQCMSAAGLGRAAKWKANMLRNAAALFSNRAADLQSYVYGDVATDTGSKQQVGSGVPPYKWSSSC